MKLIRNDCPDCKYKLHKGQHRFKDGIYFVISCKNCGFKKEEPLNEKEHLKHLKIK